jgi:hypothetical protein
VLPGDLVFGANGNLYVSSFDQVLVYNGRTGAFVTAFVSPGSGGPGEPAGLVFGPTATSLSAASIGCWSMMARQGVH